MYKTIFESSRDAMDIIRLPGSELIAGNPACLKLYGLETEEDLYDLFPGMYPRNINPTAKNPPLKLKK